MYSRTGSSITVYSVYSAVYSEELSQARQAPAEPEPLGLCQSVVTSSIGHSGTWDPAPSENNQGSVFIK